ncbi:hypothetical protein GEO60473_27250 [Geobacter sp. 60473]|nr:hypothetical protein GEO60473_27250 [Geobacter sp. 60473]
MVSSGLCGARTVYADIMACSAAGVLLPIQADPAFPGRVGSYDEGFRGERSPLRIYPPRA